MIDRASMRLGCLLPMVSLAMVIGGGQSIFTAVSNRKPTEVAMEGILQKAPSAKWLRIKGGVLDVANAGYSSMFGVANAASLYIPLVLPEEDSSEGIIRVLVLSKDPELVGFINDMREVDRNQAAPDAKKEFLLQNLSKLRVARNVEGVVQYGIEAGGKKERKIRQLYGNLASDVLILEEGARPDMGLGVFMLVGGLALGWYLMMRPIAGEPQPPVPPHSPLPGSGPPPLPKSGPPPLPPQ